MLIRLWIYLRAAWNPWTNPQPVARPFRLLYDTEAHEARYKYYVGDYRTYQDALRARDVDAVKYGRQKNLYSVDSLPGTPLDDQP